MSVETDASLRRKNKPVIGLAGGIGSGKSLVAAIIEELGGKVIDSDRMTDEEFQNPEVQDAFRCWWGEGICHADGSIDRKAVADIIFRRSAERTRMEEFLYPRLERRRKAMMKAFDDAPEVKAIVLDSPLLYEFGLDRACDAVIFVEADRSVRLGRLAETRGWTESEYVRREKLQKPLDTKRKTADFTVINNSDVDALRSQVKTIVAQLLGEALAR